MIKISMTGKCCDGYTYKCQRCEQKFCQSCQYFYGQYCYACYYVIKGHENSNIDNEVKNLKDQINTLHNEINNNRYRVINAKINQLRSILDYLVHQDETINRDNLIASLKDEYGDPDNSFDWI